MAKLILASHGKLAKGMLDSVEMIIGKQKNILAYELDPGVNPEVIAREIERLVINKEKIVILTDVVGGSVYNSMLRLVKYENVYVVGGMNLSLVLEILFSLNDVDGHAIKKAIDNARAAMVFANEKLKEEIHSGDGDI